MQTMRRDVMCRNPCIACGFIGFHCVETTAKKSPKISIQIDGTYQKWKYATHVRKFAFSLSRTSIQIIFSKILKNNSLLQGLILQQIPFPHKIYCFMLKFIQMECRLTTVYVNLGGHACILFIFVNVSSIWSTLLLPCPQNCIFCSLSKKATKHSV